LITQFPSHEDIRIAYKLTEESCERHFPTIKYRKLIIEETYVDDVHDEIEETEKQFANPVTTKGYVEPDEESYSLGRFGLDKARNVILSVSVPHMIRAGLAQQDSVSLDVTLACRIGDRFTYSKLVYDILDIVRGRMFANTDIPLFYNFRAELFRDESDLFVEDG